MHFHEVWTSYSAIGKNRFKRDWKRYYEFACFSNLPYPELDERKFSRESLLIEYAWYKKDKPYYQIWPGVIDEFINTRIDIDTELLKVPHDVFAIKLPKTNILNFTYNGILSNIDTLLVGFSDYTEQKYLCWRTTFSVDGYDNPGNMMFSVPLNKGATIEECIGKFTDIKITGLSKNLALPASIQDACLRLIVGVIFLATGAQKILEYDVLSKHLEAYRKLSKDSPQRREYEKKARAKGKHGWNIGYGRGRKLNLNKRMTYEQAIKEKGSRELLYQHVRGGHWHTVRYGTNRQKIKVVWFDPTVVRKDLPPKPLREKL